MEYSIKDVTEKFEINASTLRYYEKEGLLPIIKKGRNGQRIYCDKDLEWLKIIMCMRKTGMGISYIKEYIRMCYEGDSTIQKRYQVFLNQKQIIEKQMRKLEDNMKTVLHKINYYEQSMENHKDPMNPTAQKTMNL